MQTSSSLKTMVIGITGHRPQKLGGYNENTNRSKAVKQKLWSVFEQHKPKCIVSGMALGVDQWAVEVALEMKIPILALIPCAGQEKIWPANSQDKYQDLLLKIIQAGGSVEYVSDLPYNPALQQMQKRNQEIVNHCDRLVAIWDGTWGGTGSCVRLAQKAKRPITKIHPQTLQVEEL